MIIRKKTDIRDFLPLGGKGGESHQIKHRNWIDTRVASAVFDIAHDEKNIYLNYMVDEAYVRAVNTEYNSSVWEDSCVEFFIVLGDDDGRYYNFEFNAIGTCLGAYGHSRHERKSVPAEVLGKIDKIPSLGSVPFEKMEGPVHWTLQLRLPIKVFRFHNKDTLSGLRAMVNFYKCGDLLPQPHFLSWSPVHTESPDFHQPSYFGEASFE